MNNKTRKSGNANMVVAFVVLLAIVVIVSLVGAYVMKPEPETIIGEV